LPPPDGRLVNGERRAEADERGRCTRVSGGSATDGDRRPYIPSTERAC